MIFKFCYSIFFLSERNLRFDKFLIRFFITWSLTSFLLRLMRIFFLFVQNCKRVVFLLIFVRLIGSRVICILILIWFFYLVFEERHVQVSMCEDLSQVFCCEQVKNVFEMSIFAALDCVEAQILGDRENHGKLYNFIVVFVLWDHLLNAVNSGRWNVWRHVSRNVKLVNFGLNFFHCLETIEHWHIQIQKYAVEVVHRSSLHFLQSLQTVR